MVTNVFHSFMASILNNLSAVQRSFEDNKTFPFDSVMSHSLESLAGQVENLRKFLIDGYEKA